MQQANRKNVPKTNLKMNQICVFSLVCSTQRSLSNASKQYSRKTAELTRVATNQRTRRASCDKSGQEVGGNVAVFNPIKVNFTSFILNALMNTHGVNPRIFTFLFDQNTIKPY